MNILKRLFSGTSRLAASGTPLNFLCQETCEKLALLGGSTLWMASGSGGLEAMVVTGAAIAALSVAGFRLTR